MERDVLNVGDTVTITEGRLSFAYYYVAEPSLAMSGNYPPTERILSRTGKVIKKREEDGTFYLDIELEN